MDTFLPQEKARRLIWHDPERKLYDVNLNTKEYKEIGVELDYDDLTAHESGFAEVSEWMQYCLNESALNSLKDLTDDNISGCQFDKEKQIKAFSKINANTEGTCGKNVYHFVKGKLGNGEFL